VNLRGSNKRLEQKNGELHNISLAKYYHNVHIKENEIGRECRKHWSCEKFIQYSVLKIQKE
jgi:hypothetical protein